ncbi:MAG: hypothetical protein LBU42_03360 [Prevotellaceae bacterium]|nr:hypothetical protein [Prevotellaceae bacterium]
MLNADYANTGIQFRSIGSDFIDDDAFYNELDTSEYATLYATGAHSDAIDIYVLGTSTTTYGVAGAAASIPSTAFWIHGNYYNTSVFSHEMGHCLGLYHTHHGTVDERGDANQCKELVNGSNSSICGDYITDTPADPNIWNGCNYNGSVRDTNNQSYNPDPSNYMAYSNYVCWDLFTSAQIERVHDFIDNTPILQNVILPTISGSSTICTTPVTYTLPIGTATSWTVQPTSAFSITSQNATSAVVKALDYTGTPGTLTAIVGGIDVTKDISTCNITISGNTTICTIPVTYTLSGGTATFWSVQPTSAFSITSQNATSVEIKALNYNGTPGTLTAIVGGIGVTKAIQTCSLNVSISGPSSACSGSTVTFSITDAPTSYTWSSSFHLALRSTSGNTASFLANINGSASVRILVADIEVARYNFVVGTPAGGINGPYQNNYLVGVVNPGNYQFMATGLPSNIASSNVVWELVQPTNALIPKYSGINPTVQFTESGAHTLKMKWNGSCGYSPYVTKNILVTASSGGGTGGGGGSILLSAYPNPASSVLYVEIGEELQAMLQSRQASLSSANVYRVQLVAAQTGAVAFNQILSSNSGALSINLSNNVPDGLYSLIVTKNDAVLHSETVLIQH